MRRRRERFRCRDLNKVTAMIQLLIDCHPEGFKILLGMVPPPTPHEIHEMMDSQRGHVPSEVRATSPEQTVEAERIVWDAEKFEEAVEAADGWPHIVKICREHREYAPRHWAIVMDHARYVKGSTTRYESRITKQAYKYRVSPLTITRQIKGFAEELARAILIPDADNENWGLVRD